MAPAAAPTPVPMRSPLPAPYPVPAPTAAPPAAPTAAPVTVPQAVTVAESMSRPTNVVIACFRMMRLLRRLPLESELAWRRDRRGCYHRAGRRARLTTPGYLDVGPPIGGRADDRRRLLPQLLIVGLREHHRPADADSSGDRADDLEHADTLT